MIHDNAILADNVDFVFPSATFFTDKEDYEGFTGSFTDRKESEVSSIRAVWITQARFEDTQAVSESQSPIFSVFFELNVFHSLNFERKDEGGAIDSFERKIARSDFEHDLAVLSLADFFSGGIPLNLAHFTESDLRALSQVDDTQRNIQCPFIDGEVFGSWTTLETVAILQPEFYC